MQFLIGSSVFVLGAIVGSFLNVLVLRRGTGLGLFRSSFCFSCGGRLRARNLVPIVSFLAQRGKCQECQSSISPQYPLVEFVTAGVFLAVFWKTGLLAEGFSVLGNSQLFTQLLITIYQLLIASILLAITIYDIRHKIIPNTWVYTFDILALFGAFGVWNIGFGSSVPVLQAIGAGALLFLFFGSLWLFSRGRWMGLGDAKLALGIGFLLGFSGGTAAVVLSFWIGALVGVAFIVSQKLLSSAQSVTMKSEIPFAPFLVAGLAIVWFFEISFADLQMLFAL